MLDLTLEERRYLRDLLDSAHAELVRGLHHAATSEYKDRLRHELDINERIGARVGAIEPVLVEIR